MCLSGLTLSVKAAEPGGLAVAKGSTGKAYLTYDGEPLLAFGPANEAHMLAGDHDLQRWARWQVRHRMNLLRTYPTSIPLTPWGTTGEAYPFEHIADGNQWDVDQFNDTYFDLMANKLATLEELGIIVHLQLWQVTFFKPGERRWDANYLNPANNVNPWTDGYTMGTDYINAPADSAAREHQRKWVEHILRAAKGRGNVIIDVLNELGNKQGDLSWGTMEWASVIAGWIRAYEHKHGTHFIVGVDSEHFYDPPEQFHPYMKNFDIVILNELKSPEYAMTLWRNFQMPMVTVRSSDGTYHGDRDYLFARNYQTGPEHQIRYRTLCYRSLFSNVQSIGAYWKMKVEDADYRDLDLWEQSSEALRTFWETIKPHWPELVRDDTIIRSGSPSPQAYGMRSPNLNMFYFEAGAHQWNHSFPATKVTLQAPEDCASVLIFHPATGEFAGADYTHGDGLIAVSLPDFTDDLVVVMWGK